MADILNHHFTFSRYYILHNAISKHNFEGSIVVMRSRKSKDRKYYDQTIHDKRTNNGVQSTTQNTETLKT
jgi:hypothetical protein